MHVYKSKHGMPPFMGTVSISFLKVKCLSQMDKILCNLGNYLPVGLHYVFGLHYWCKK